MKWDAYISMKSEPCFNQQSSKLYYSCMKWQVILQFEPVSLPKQQVIQFEMGGQFHKFATVSLPKLCALGLSRMQECNRVIVMLHLLAVTLHDADHH